MNWYAGIDVGSLTADAVLIDEEANVVGFAIIPTSYDSMAAGSEAYRLALERAGVLEDEVSGVVSTGYSRARVQEAQVARTEISCHARGAFHIFSDVATIIDIGGQDSKAIRVGPGGRVLDFAMNDKCAAGTGRFLEVMAGALGISLPDMADLALASTVEITISSTCTVFAESEVVSLISQGRAPADIASAICRAIAQRTAGLAARVGISDRVVMTGGVAKNQAVVRMLADKLGFGISVPEEPQITGALGAALIARANSAS